MSKNQNRKKEVIAFYNLLLEDNFQTPYMEFEKEESTLEGEDPLLPLVRRLNTKAKAQLHTSYFVEIDSILQKLKAPNSDLQSHFESALMRPGFEAVATFFRNFSSLNDEDRISMIKDAHLLEKLQELMSQKGV